MIMVFHLEFSKRRIRCYKNRYYTIPHFFRDLVIYREAETGEEIK